LSNQLTRNNDYNNSVKYLGECAGIYLKEGVTKEAASALVDMAAGYRNLNKLDSAIITSTRATRLFQSVKDTVGMATSMASTGFYYFQKYKLKEAFEAVSAATILAELTTDEMVKAKCYTYLSMLYMEVDNDIPKAWNGTEI
jgi:hypothetical protein